jgi:hypothetical protein
LITTGATPVTGDTMPPSQTVLNIKTKPALVLEPKTSIELHPLNPILSIFGIARSSIDDKHAQLGGDGGLLGVATEEMKGCPDAVGFFRRYRNGMIYFNPATNAHEIHGAILDKWSALGFERSFLGYPVTDETATADAVGRFNVFQGGRIYWTPSSRAHEVHGAILGRWAALGFEQSYLGYPVSDEENLRFGSGRSNSFQNGQIAWSPASGAAVSSSSFRINNTGGVKPQGVGGDGVPEVRRRVVLSAHIDLTDDETFGSNEHGSADGQTEGFVSNKTPRTLLSLIGKAGGEVRVELSLDAVAVTEGDVQMSGSAKLFEGTSEESDDLDGTAPINFTVPRDNFIKQSIHVRNSDEGGDFADITLVVSNFPA